MLLPYGMPCDLQYKSFLGKTLAPFLEARKTRRSKIDFLLDLFQLLPAPRTADASASQFTPALYLWDILASYCTDALKTKAVSGTGSSNSSTSHDQPLGAEYRSIIKVLDYGIACEPFLSKVWENLFLALSDVVTIETGESGCAIVVIEPLARTLHELPTSIQSHVWP